MRRDPRRHSVAALLAMGLATTAAAQAPPLRDLDDTSEPYRTPRSGEGVRGSVFGSPRDVPPRDRHNVAAWTVGAALAPHADESEAWPYGSLYFWDQHDGHLLRAVVAGAYNDVLWSAESTRFLWFSSYTPPWSSGELTDGEVADAEKVQWGYARLGLGVGLRDRVGPQQDNIGTMTAAIEPGLLYFGRADDTAAAFRLPDSTFEWRAHLQLRWDVLERNLLELPHSGFCCGLDAIYGERAQWDSWGLPGTEVHDGHSGRDYVLGSLSVFAIGDLPTVRDDRWRAFASLHAGAGDTLDRFSATRVGGGPDLRGEEWDTTARPWLPGSAAGEFFPEHYAIGSLGLRRELTFFAYLDVGGTVAWLDRDRLRNGARVRRDDVLTAVSTRLTTGFVGNTRLLVDYAWGFDVVRSGERGGHEIAVQVSGRF